MFVFVQASSIQGECVAFVREDQSRGLDPLLMLLPADAMALYVRAIPFARDDRLFLSVTPMQRKKRLIIDVSALTPRSASSYIFATRAAMAGLVPAIYASRPREPFKVVAAVRRGWPGRPRPRRWRASERHPSRLGFQTRHAGAASAAIRSSAFIASLGRVSSAAARFSRRCPTDEVPGISRMFGER
jgi:hypothetical protein